MYDLRNLTFFSQWSFHLGFGTTFDMFSGYTCRHLLTKSSVESRVVWIDLVTCLNYAISINVKKTNLPSRTIEIFKRKEKSLGNVNSTSSFN